MEDIVKNFRETLPFQMVDRKRTDFGPFIFKVLNIWLFLSIALRFKGATVGTPILAMIYIALSWLCLYFSFRVIASEFIYRTGGSIPQHNFSSGIARWPECRTVLGFIAFLTFLAIIIAGLFGVENPLVKPLAWAFDGIAYDHHSVWHSVCSAFFATFVFLCFLSHSFGFEAKRRDIYKQIIEHGRHLAPAMAILIIGYVVLSLVQGWVRTPLSNWMMATKPAYAGAIYLTFMFLFSTARLVLSVVVIGCALNLSYARLNRLQMPPAY